MANNDHAIVIGINKYKHLTDLKGPVNDAMCFREWLLDPDGGDVPKDQIDVLLSEADAPHACPDPALPAEAVLSSIDYARIDELFDDLITIAADTGERVGRRLYVFLAGHGLGPTPSETVVLMSNGDNAQRSGFHIPGRRYIEWFRAAALFEEIVLFMDCCRDIPGPVQMKPPPWPDSSDPAGADVKFCFGFGTKWSSKARERAVPGCEHVHGVFTCALLDALKHSPPNDEGQVLASTIAGYVRERLKKLEDEGFFKPGEFEKRRPEFDHAEHSDFVFLHRETATRTPVRITFSAPDASTAVKLMSNEVVGDDFEVVGTRESMTGTWEIPLAAGFYFLQAIEPGTGHITKQKAFSVTGQEVTHVTF
jgi:hypothetical protein